MKYVVFKIRHKDSNGSILEQEIPVIFPKQLVHKDVAKALIQNCEGLENALVVSAGFVDISTMSCRGESESIGVKSRPDLDRILINGNDHMHGIL